MGFRRDFEANRTTLATFAGITGPNLGFAGGA